MEERIIVSENHSEKTKLGGLIVSVIPSYSNEIIFIVGRPGFPNIKNKLTVGGAVLFETPEGLFEVRIMTKNATGSVSFLISQISPSPGIAGGLIDVDPSNIPFSTEEIKRISGNIKEIQLAISKQPDITPEQVNYIHRKLDEMREASKRLGRKDWINLAVGTLTSIIVTSALNANIAKFLLNTASTALSWLFGGVVKLLP